MTQRFSKPLGDIPAFKLNLVENNAAELARSKRLAALYIEQPKRTNCKLCEEELPPHNAFCRYRVPYVFCSSCGHLNGRHQDTAAYSNEVYLKLDYGSDYRDQSFEDYSSRVRHIYQPKADFLCELLGRQGETLENMHAADFGAGSGHFIAALSNCGLRSTGYEISEGQVEFAKSMLAKNYPLADIQTEPPEAIADLAIQHTAAITSLIGVLEHLGEPVRFLNQLRSNPNVRYWYVSVPLFSLAVYLEAALPNMAPRVLEGGHTHLFTVQSLEYLEKKFRLRRIGEWWFGLDAFDLFRALELAISSQPDTTFLTSRLLQEVPPLLDDIQAAIDKNRMCSEVHILYAIPD